MKRSNNTNKLSPQERNKVLVLVACRSNNTNKLSPQELIYINQSPNAVQIIQINLVLKNPRKICSKPKPFK